MSQAGDLRKSVHLWLRALPARIHLPDGGPLVSKADVRAVCDVLQNNVRYSDWTVREAGTGPPMTAISIAREVGRGRELVAAILAGLDHIGLTTLLQRHGGADHTTIRALNPAFGQAANVGESDIGTAHSGRPQPGRPAVPMSARATPNVGVADTNVGESDIFELA